MRIEELRKDKNLSQEAIAWRSDLDRTYMNRILKRKTNMTMQSLEKIVVNGLEMTLADFFDSKIFTDK